MENLVLLKTEDLRQLIREELKTLSPRKEQDNIILPPITTKELCSFLKITQPTLIRWRKKGKIPFIQIGSAIRFDLVAVIKALEVTRKSKS